MTDDSPATPTSGAPAATASADKAPAAPSVPLAIIAQYVKDLSFENPRAPAVFASTTPPQSSANVSVQTRHLGERAYEVLLNMRIEGTVGGEAAYIVELSYGGVFAVGQVPDEIVEPLLMVEAPRLLFPFARSVAASATREGGFPQILINPIDFGAMYRARRQQQAAASQPGAQAGAQPGVQPGAPATAAAETPAANPAAGKPGNGAG